jgi:hypothetical protein
LSTTYSPWVAPNPVVTSLRTLVFLAAIGQLIHDVVLIITCASPGPTAPLPAAAVV